VVVTLSLHDALPIFVFGCFVEGAVGEEEAAVLPGEAGAGGDGEVRCFDGLAGDGVGGVFPAEVFGGGGGPEGGFGAVADIAVGGDRKSTRLNSSHVK